MPSQLGKGLPALVQPLELLAVVTGILAESVSTCPHACLYVHVVCTHVCSRVRVFVLASREGCLCVRVCMPVLRTFAFTCARLDVPCGRTLRWPPSSSASFCLSPGRAPCCLQSRCFLALSPACRLQAGVRRWRPHQQGDLTVVFQQGCDQPWLTFLEGLGCHMAECGGGGSAALGTRSEAEVPGRCQADEDGMAHCTPRLRGGGPELSQPVLGRMDESWLAQSLHVFSYLATTKTRSTGLGQWCRLGPDSHSTDGSLREQEVCLLGRIGRRWVGPCTPSPPPLWHPGNWWGAGGNTRTS